MKGQQQFTTEQMLDYLAKMKNLALDLGISAQIAERLKRLEELETRKAPVTYVQRTLMRDFDGRLIAFDIPADFDETLNFNETLEQARAWQEVAHTIHEIDPDWHQTGKPKDSAVKFIKNACKPPQKFVPSEFFTAEQQRVTSAIAKLMHTRGCQPQVWYCFEVRMCLASNTDGDNYSLRKMALFAEPRDLYADFARRIERQTAMPAVLAAPYKPEQVITKSPQGVHVEHGFVATPYSQEQALPSGATIAASVGINAQPVYNKAPGEHPADKRNNEGDEL